MNGNSKILRNELQNVLSGTSQVINGGNIQAAYNYIEKSKGTSRDAGETSEESIEKQLIEFIEGNKLWYNGDLNAQNYISRGMEQSVYLDSSNSFVLKTNDAVFYDFDWSKYLKNLMLHNFFFPATSYDLIGFTRNKLNGKLMSVVKQKYIIANGLVDTKEVELFMKEQGFNRTHRLMDVYVDEEVGITIGDLHTANVLKKDDLLYFIDTKFFVDEEVLYKKENKEMTKEIELTIDGFKIKKEGALQDGDHIQYEFNVHEISETFNHRLYGTIELNPDGEYSAMYMNEMYEENYVEKDFKKFEDAEKWVLSSIEKDIKEYKEDFDTRYEKEVEHELEKGKAVEMEHKETLEKVATGEITPEEGVLETAETHIAEDPKYYDKLEKIEMSPEKQAELKSFKQRVELLLRREYSKNTTDELIEQNKSLIEDDFGLLITADRVAEKIIEAHEKPKKDKYTSLINNAGINTEIVDNWNQVPVVWKNTKPISKVTFVNTPYNKELIKLLDVFAGNDALRPVMSGIHFDGNGITATNAHKLISLPYPNPEYNGTYATVPKRDYSIGKEEIKKDLFTSTKYPNYPAVIPKAENAIGVYEFSVYKVLQYIRVALKFTNKYTHAIAFSFGDVVIAFNGEFLEEILETALKLGHEKLFSFTSAPNRAIVLSPDRNYEIGKSELFLLMPVLIMNESENYKGGAEDLDFNREIKVYYDFSTDSIYNADGTLAEFKMNYGEYDILKPAEIKALDKYAGNNSIVPVLDNFKVENGKVFANNLDTTFTIKDSDLKDGLYRVLNGAIEYNGSDTLSSFDDYPKLEIEGDVNLSFIINSEVLKYYIEKAIDFTGNDDLRPVMSGICFDYNNGKMFMVATDAHKMFRVDITEYISEISDKKDFQFILSKNNLMKFLKVLDETTIEVKAYSKNVVFDTDDYNFVSKTIDGRYPNYNSVISAFKNKKLIINVKDLFICLKSKEAQDFIKKHKKEDVMLIDRAGSKENELDLYLFIFENTRDNSSRKIEDEVKICTVKYKYEEGTYQTHSNVILLMPIMNNEEASHFAFREKFFREILDVVNCEDVEIFYDEKNRAYLIDGDCFKYKHTIQAIKKSPIKTSVVEEVRTEKEIIEQEEKDKEVIEEQFNEPDADLIDSKTTGAGTSDAEDAIVLLNDLLEDAKGKQKKTILEAINLLKDLLDEPTDEKKEVRGEYQKGYEDLYLPDVVEMPINTTIEQLINEYDKYSGGKSNAIIKFRLGNRELIAHRKYTFQGRNVVKTKYIHIEWVDDFNKKYPIVYKTWKETKSGIKETTNPSINDWNRKNK